MFLVKKGQTIDELGKICYNENTNRADFDNMEYTLFFVGVKL